MKLLLFFVLALTTTALAQPPDYWQQHVSYKIEATLLDSVHSLQGSLIVDYTNNSPDTLREVYFHLYNNAFRPGSMMHKRAKELNDVGLYTKFDNMKPEDYGGYTINSVNVNGSGSKFAITGTVMKVSLAQPLAPKTNTTIALNFFEQIPRQTRRNGWMNYDTIKYSMAQCYPKVCAYDREGWHNQEYISREFYGVWGEFDVKLTVPAKYCVGATGQVQNPDEVKWGYEKIAKGEKKGVVYPKDYPGSGDITWHFKASNVHDFAWVAHEYVHEWDTWSDTVTVHCLYKTTEEKYWKQAMKNTFAMLEHHSNKVGWYQYRNFYNTHAGDGGMEYPQLVMDGSPNAGLIMHEGGHQWFYGMLGNNETRYAFLDEGFTEFIEMVGMEWYYGRHNERSPYRDSSWLTKMFIPEYDTRRNYYSSYLNLATDGYEEPLSIPHDWAREGVNAGQVYFKTLNGLAQLEYVLGDSVFWAGMKEYFRRWHFKSPTLHDFKRTMEDVSGTKLDWYFDQWFHTTRTIDYSACGLSSDEQPDGSYKTTIEIDNNDVGVMPIDLTLYYDDGTTGKATIPLALNQGAGYKKPEAGRLFLEPWDWVSKSYEGSIITPKEVNFFQIDSSYRLMDLDRGDNLGYPPFLGFIELKGGVGKTALFTQYHNTPPIGGGYSVFRPIIWYDEVSQMNFGIGAITGVSRNFRLGMKLLYSVKPIDTEYDPAYTEARNMHFGFEFDATLNTKILGNLTTISGEVRNTYGMLYGGIIMDHKIRPTFRYLGPDQSITFFLNGSFRGQDTVQLYPVYGGDWNNGALISGGGKYNFTSSNGYSKFGGGVEIGQSITYVQDIYNPFQFPFPIPPSFYQYSFKENFSSYTIWDVHGSQQIPFGSDWNLSLRANIRFHTGNVPPEKRTYVGGANPSEQDRSVFWKAITSIDKHFSEQANFFIEGGYGVRGFQSTYINDPVHFGLSAELFIPNPLSSWGAFTKSFQPLLFGDMTEKFADAGLGFKLDLLSWLPWQLQGVAEEYASIPKIGIYFPIFLVQPDDYKPSFAFRYAISLGTTF
jgi:hypothetical protein